MLLRLKGGSAKHRAEHWNRCLDQQVQKTRRRSSLRMVKILHLHARCHDGNHRDDDLVRADARSLDTPTERLTSCHRLRNRFPTANHIGGPTSVWTRRRLPQISPGAIREVNDIRCRYTCSHCCNELKGFARRTSLQEACWQRKV